LDFNYKLFFKYVFFNLVHFYLNHSVHGSKNVSVVIPKNLFYYSCLHMRFSSIFYSNQLVDMFAYELPLSTSNVNSLNSEDIPTIEKLILNNGLTTSNTIVVYNFHNLTYQERFFFFCAELPTKFNGFTLNSISELFPNANWLEREVSELHGVVFNNKKDLRNLMLQYGDTSMPFKKSSPSIGVKEVFYDSVNDVLIQIPVSVQS